MHPLDSSLDTSLHHENHRKAQRRRSSIDNSLLANASNELFNEDLLLLTSNNCLDDSDHCHQNQNSFSRRSFLARRYSLNNCMAAPTTFLASLAANSTTHKSGSDLDMDCPPSLVDDGSPHNNKTMIVNRNSYRHQQQHQQQQTSLDTSQGNSNSNKAHAISDCNSHSYDDDDDCDSFCDASRAEPANQEYMLQDLGASCFWNDDIKFLDLVEHQQQQDDELLKEMSTEELDFYGDDDDDDDVDQIPVEQKENYSKSTSNENVSRGVMTRNNAPGVDTGAAATARNGFCVDDDDDESCDSFCDATDKEPANREYLKRDLGASCYWNSQEELSSWNSEVDDMVAPSVLSNSIGTITEEA